MSETCHVVLTYCSLHLCKFSGVNSSVAVSDLGKSSAEAHRVSVTAHTSVKSLFSHSFSFSCGLLLSHFDMFYEVSIFVK